MTEAPTTDAGKAFAPFEDAYYGYLRALSLIASELNEGVIGAQKQGAPVPGDDQAAVTEKMRGYGEAVRGTWEESQKRYTAAYFEFLDKFGDAWAHADRAFMSPPAVTAIAQSAAAAAGYAASTIGNLDVFAWTGVPLPGFDGAKSAPDAGAGAA